MVIGLYGLGALANTVYSWFCLRLATSGVASVQVSCGVANVSWAPDELSHSRLFVMALQLTVAAPLAERYNSRDRRGWTPRPAVSWLLYQLVVWSVTDGRNSDLWPLWHAASLTVHSRASLQDLVQHRQDEEWKLWNRKWSRVAVLSRHVCWSDSTNAQPEIRLNSTKTQ